MYVMPGKIRCSTLTGMTLRINRVYTRAGDDGLTALLGGQRVPKDHPRVEAYGCLDELNGIVGLCRAALTSGAAGSGVPEAARRVLDGHVVTIQHRLFDCGSVPATPEGAPWDNMPVRGGDDGTGLGTSRDEMNRSLPELTSVVLPG